MHRLILNIIIPLLLLSACYEKDFSTPAQEQINEYRKIGQICMAKKQQNPAEATTPPTSNEAIASPAPQIDSSTMFMIQQDDIVLGNPSSQIIVFEYSAPTCSHCAYFHKEIFPALKTKYIDTGKVAYIIRPLISSKQDLDAAILARCAPQEQFLKLITILYEKQDAWAFNSNYRQILTNIGQLATLTPEQYNSCIENNNLTNFFINNTRAITRLPKFVGTPSFVIDGSLLENAYTLDNLSNAIDTAIKKYGKPQN